MATVQTQAQALDHGQQHPISTYLKVWGWLFVLSTMSYMVDYLGIQSYPRWFLITLFMLMKAGMIVAVFMHMMYERLALMYAILLPPLLLLVLVGIMLVEGDYTYWTRILFFGVSLAPEGHEAALI
jgi:cytochrome c oxidase subunit IV